MRWTAAFYIVSQLLVVAPVEACAWSIANLSVAFLGTGSSSRIAILTGEGSSPASVEGIEKILQKRPATQIHRLIPGQVADGQLNRYSALIVPGGRASQQYEALGEAGRTAVRSFVEPGGAYIGICAGAYLAVSEPDKKCLSLVPLRVKDREHWRRGYGRVEIAPESGFSGIGWPSRFVYANGPLLEVVGPNSFPAVEVVARFDGEVEPRAAGAQPMRGAISVARARYGQGGVVLYSGHPEFTPGAKFAFLSLADWALHAPVASSAD